MPVLVGAGAGLGWLVLVFCERKTLLAGWFGWLKLTSEQAEGHLEIPQEEY